MRDRIVPAILTCALALAPVHAADVEQCDGCHGEGGVRTDSAVPTIAGLSEFVVEDYLLTFQDEARPCRAGAFEGKDASDHCAMAKALGEDAILEMAAHYSGKTFVPAKQETDAAKAAAGAKVHDKQCESCHSEGGSLADDDASILAGQWMPYLDQAFADFASGARPQPKSMKKKLDALTPEQVDALVHFYASGG